MLIAASRTAQLGNRLQLFAHLIATAEEAGTGLVNPGFTDYCDYFETTSHDVLCRYPERQSFVRPTTLRRKVIRKSLEAFSGVVRRARFLPGVDYISTGYKQDLCIRDVLRQRRGGSGRGLVFVRGYFFKDPDAVLRHADKIRAHLRPAPAYRDRVAAFVGRTRVPGAALVGVHVRQGDYKKYEGGKYYYDLPAYRAIMARAVDLFAPRPVQFMVCSDQRLTPADFPNLPVAMGPGDLADDLFALASCDYLIGPKSTFSQWASFYARVPRYVIQSADHPFTLDDFAICAVPA